MAVRRAIHNRFLLQACAAILCLIAVPVRAPAQKPNVLLITVDTFRPDHIGVYGYGRNTTPALDRLAEDGVVFTDAISSSSWTTPGLLSGLTGLWAPTHGVDVRGKALRKGTPTMATLLREAGYAAPDILYLSSLPNFQNLGLTATYPERDRYLPSGDEVLFKALEAYQDSTFFLYYHYRNLHLPYNPTPPYDRMFTPRGFDRSGFVRD
ncbi:MAG: sulfatase-like hydrolase/transferase, partial [Candidatus Latescibacteria bacterium]|nr:sulfatase-like hydrolase/transferase [Candidatus Latescibacterota bacterium]